MSLGLLVTLVLGGWQSACGRIGFEHLASDGVAGGSDSGSTGGNATSAAGSAGAMAASFGEPRLIEALADPAMDDDPSFTANRLELYFNSERAGGPGRGDIWVSRRDSVEEPWGSPELLTEVSSPSAESTPGVSGDGLWLWFASNRAGCAGGLDIWVSERSNTEQAWSEPTCVAELNSVGVERGPAATASLLGLVFTSNRRSLADGDLYFVERTSIEQPWGSPEPILGVSSPADDGDARLVAAGLELYLGSTRDAYNGDIYRALRSSVSSDFAIPVVVSELSTTDSESDPWPSEDGRYIVFTSNRSGNFELWEASR